MSFSEKKPLFLSHQSLPHLHHSNSLAPDAARLWDRWFKHALLLKERRVLSTERLVQLFTPLLLERHATYSHQVALEAHTLPRDTQIGGDTLAFTGIRSKKQADINMRISLEE